MRAAPSAFVAAILITGLVAVAAGLVPVIERHKPSEVDAILDAPVLPASAARLLAFGFRNAIADITYLQAIQVVAAPQNHDLSMRQLSRKGLAAYRLLDYTTTLDPLFSYAYVFGANAIPVEREDGSAVNVKEAAKLLERGVNEAKPDWRIPFHLAFLRSAYLQDYAGAAEAMKVAVSIEGRPEYLPLLATRLAAQGGAIDTGLALAAAMRDNATDDDQRELYDNRLRLLEMERDLRIIEMAADRFVARHGHRPPSVEALVTAGILRGVPMEPFGGSYVYDALLGQARSTAKERMRVYTDEDSFGPTVDDERPPPGLVRDDLPEISSETSASTGTGAP